MTSWIYGRLCATLLKSTCAWSRSKTEPAYKVELVEERKRREQLERRLNELVDENRRSREMAEEMERSASIRAELQRLGVTKVDLAFKAVKEDIHTDQRWPSCREDR